MDYTCQPDLPSSLRMELRELGMGRHTRGVFPPADLDELLNVGHFFRHVDGDVGGVDPLLSCVDGTETASRRDCSAS